MLSLSILFNLFFFFNIIGVYICLFFYILVKFLYSKELKLKFFYFFIFLIFCVIWGFYNFLDGIYLIFFNIELSLILYCIVLYTQVMKKVIGTNTNTSISVKNYIFTFLLFFIFFYLNFIQNTFFQFNYYINNYFLYCNNVVSADFFFLYKFFFIDYMFLVICFIVLLSFFSFFFILLFFMLKKYTHVSKKQTQQLEFLKKQSLINQSNFNTTLSLFTK